MSENQELKFAATDEAGQNPANVGGMTTPAEGAVPPEEAASLNPAAGNDGQKNGTDVGPAGPPRWHVEAGRKGARRIHQLIEQGKLYEQEHGLKSGRQRLRQLIQEGKLYEQEHGLRGTRKPR